VFPLIRHALTQIDSQMVVDDPERMELAVADSIARERFAMVLFSIFAAGALLLASIGIYGVLSYVVGQRTREIGIRMALGAKQGDVVLAVLRDGFRMTLPGVGIGVLVALALTRLMSAILFGVKPTDIVTYASVAALLCAVALLACYVPARRAAKLDPMQALRSD
jgi:ABC-type antimicrobial peptide transport system permease subunit